MTEKIKHNNTSGSSLSLCLSQNIRALYFCAVLDPNLFPRDVLVRRSGRVNCEIINARTKDIREIYSMDFENIDSSKHVFLWRQEFNSDEPLLDPILFSFFSLFFPSYNVQHHSDTNYHVTRLPRIRKRSTITHIRCNDAIIEFGVHPVSCDDMLSDDDDDDDDDKSS